MTISLLATAGSARPAVRVQSTPNAPSSAGGAATTRATVHVNVLRVTDLRLPSLSEAQLHEVLTRAAGLIAAEGGPKVIWGHGQDITAASFVDLVRTRIAPLPLADPDTPSPGHASEDGALRAQAQALVTGLRGLEYARLFLGEKPVANAGGPAAVAHLLAGEYIRRTDGLAARCAPDGTPLLAGDAGAAYRLTTWAMAQALGEAAHPQLILFNGFTIEDDPRGAPFHSLSRGLALGLTAPGLAQSAVAYAPLLSDFGDLSPLKIRLDAEDAQLDAIAYVVAHEVGGHALLHLSDAYAPEAGFLRPISLADSLAALRPPVTRPAAIPLPMNLVSYDHLRRRARIHAAQRDADALMADVEALNDLNVDDAMKDDLMKLIGSGLK